MTTPFTTDLTTPVDAMTQALRSYLDGRDVQLGQRDGFERMLDGVIVKVVIKQWKGWVKLSAEDVGLSSTAYAQLGVTWGRINLLSDTIRLPMDSLAARMRQKVIHWGRKVQGGRFIPLKALGGFRREFDALHDDWLRLLAQWQDDYDAHVTFATTRIAALAARAAEVAARLDEPIGIDAQEMESRLMASYPTPHEVADMDATYRVTLLPTPALLAEQAAQLEVIAAQKQERLAQVRREAEQRQYAHDLDRAQALAAIDAAEQQAAERERVVREERERLRRDLEAERRRLLDDFYRGYALDIRQRLHESLMFVVEGVRGGKVSPAAGRSLRTALEDIRQLALDDDAEIQAMQVRLQELLGDAGEGSIEPADIQEDIEQIGVLLQSSILALGEQPRMPRRGGHAIAGQDMLAELPAGADLRATVRHARQQLGLEAPSLGEALIAAGNLTTDTLRRRRVALPETDDA